MKTYTINADTHPMIFNLLTLPEVCDCDIVLYNSDADCNIHLGDLIESALEELTQK